MRYEGEKGISFSLWMRETEINGKKDQQLCCDTVWDVIPPPRALQTLLALQDNRLLLDTPIQEGLPYVSSTGDTIIDIHGNVTPNWHFDFRYLPKGSAQWIRDTHSFLSKRSSNFIKQLRWFQNVAGSYRPIAHIGAYFSSDDSNWTIFPSEFSLRLEQPKAIDTSETARTRFSSFLSHNIEEPVGHDLMREAAELADKAPRSALLVAFAALEAGLKSQLTKLVPEASALIEKIPSPPLTTILQEVLPSIIKAKGISSDYFPMNDIAFKYLRKWNTQRNQVTHGSKHSVNIDDVKDFILFARDLLYLLDLLDGHGWATDHLKSDKWSPL